MSEARTSLADARRIVIKIGSRLLATREGLVDSIAAQVAHETKVNGRQFVLVSSGAISLGTKKLGYARRPKDMPRLQAAAAVGQSELMRRYADAFGQHGQLVAQILLTGSDLASRRRLNNAQQALSALLETGAVPIINENDTVSTEEISLGDNDQLASMVVPVVQADLLFLLTDIDGVLDPDGQRIPTMWKATPMGTLGNGNSHGTGGMASKVNAARKAAHSGASVVIASAKDDTVVHRVLAGEDIGTLFEPRDSTLRARQHWIAYTLKPRGRIIINEGAAAAILEGTNSLLPVGVIGVSGQFSRGDAVILTAPDGLEIARGLARLGVAETARVAGKSNAEISAHSGEPDTVVVHKNDLVLTD